MSEPDAHGRPPESLFYRMDRLPDDAGDMIGIVKDALISRLGLHPVQLLSGDHDIPLDREFTFTAFQIDDMWTMLNHAHYRIDCEAGRGDFQNVAYGILGQPLDTYMGLLHR